MVLVVAGSILFHVLSPWRATPIASNWGFIDDTMGLTFLVTGAGFVAVILFMAYCLYRFRHVPGRRAAYEPENQKLEAWLGIVTTIAVIILLAPGLFVWGQFITVPEGRDGDRSGGQSSGAGASACRAPTTSSARATCVTSTPTNSMGLSPTDPKGQDDLLITSGELHLPIGKPVKVLLRSIDVLHDFYVPEISAKMDLVPGDRHLFLVHADQDRRV